MEFALTITVSLIIGAALAALLAYIFLAGRHSNGSATPTEPNRDFFLLQDQIRQLIKTVDDKLGSSNKEMQEAVRHQFGESQKLIRDITEKVTKVEESSRQVFTVAEALQNLEKVLKHQKQRGNLGEAGLELILSNVLPPGQYKMQYAFRGGDQVDAVIMTKEGMIPVDAKFSLDNYNRIINENDDNRRTELEKIFRDDLKKRINETAKYIRPEEGTLPFAFMFIPAEGIYYDLLVNEVGAIKSNTRSLIDYAYRDKNVIVVSPTTFAAYLQSVIYGFRAFKIEEGAKEIRQRVGELGKHLAAYDQFMAKLGNSLGTTVNHYNTAHKELKKIDKDVVRINGESAGIEPVVLDRPRTDD
ncbi:MAG: DNA recombination protein RmuC [Candidatus Paceibacterota bacterium]